MRRGKGWSHAVEPMFVGILIGHWGERAPGSKSGVIMAATVSRSLSVKLFVPKLETTDGPSPNWVLHRQIVNAIRGYRFATHKMYAAIMLGQVAGAEIQETGSGEHADIRLKPTTKTGTVALATAIGAATVTAGEKTTGEGQAFKVQASATLGYSLRTWFREHLYPTALSFVWDSARQDATSVWTSKDPQFTKGSRGYMALQGVRGIAKFQRRGIGCPVATARPKLSSNTLTLKWDHDIGPVQFSLERLDYGRWKVWEALRDNEPGWKLGTIYLTERRGGKNPDGKQNGPELFAVITYSRPTTPSEVDADRACAVSLGSDMPGWMSIRGPNPQTEHDSIDANAIVGWLRMMLMRREAIEARREASGSPRQPWGHRRQYRDDTEVLTALSARRARRQADFNHAISRRIVARAVAWRCGVVKLGPFPELMFGHPWGWAQLENFLTYKLQMHGIALVREEPSTQ